MAQQSTDEDVKMAEAVVHKIRALIDAELDAARLTGERRAMVTSMIASATLLSAGFDADEQFADKIVITAIISLIQVAQTNGWIEFKCDNCGAGLDTSKFSNMPVLQ